MSQPTSMLAEPLAVDLSSLGYRGEYRVLGVELRRNYDGGPVLSLAIAETRLTPNSDWRAFRDIVGCMRLADATSADHVAPINAKKWYGKQGRGVIVSRAHRFPWAM